MHIYTYVCVCRNSIKVIKEIGYGADIKYLDVF